MKIFRYLITAFTLVFVFSGFVFAQDALKLHFIDVGEGEAILIQSGGENALIDTGNLLSGYKLLDYLKSNKAECLKYLILTHPHADHIGGVFFILPEISVDNIYDNAQALDQNDDIERWYGALVRKRDNYRRLLKKDKLKLGNAVLEVLHPAESASASYNDNSLVIRLRCGNFSCLFSADTGKKVEKELIDEKAGLRSNILKVGHHGFRDATSKEFLEAVSPEAAVICTSPDNRMGPVSSETLESLRSKGIKIYRIDECGNIVIDVDQEGKYSIRAGI